MRTYGLYLNYQDPELINTTKAKTERMAIEYFAERKQLSKFDLLKIFLVKEIVD